MMSVKDLQDDGWILLPLEEYKNVPTTSGVYCLLMDNNIVYVGKSKCLFNRIYNHRTCKRGEFDALGYKLYPEESITEIEKLYIKKLHPRDNKNEVPFNVKKHISIKNIFQHIFYAGYDMGDSFSYVKPFSTVRQVEELLVFYNIPLYKEANRICISSADRSKFIKMVYDYIYEYVDDNMSTNNFFYENPPRFLSQRTWEYITVEELRSYMKSDKEAFDIQRKQQEAEMRRYDMLLREGRIAV